MQVKPSIVPPSSSSYSSTYNCIEGIPCTVRHTSAYSFSTIFNLCSLTVNTVYFTLWDNSNSTYIFSNQTMTISNTFSYSFLPAYADVATQGTFNITARSYVNGYIFASHQSIAFKVKTVSCSILPPTTSVTTLACVIGSLCTLSVTPAYTYSNTACLQSSSASVSAPLSFMFTLTDVTSSSILIS